MRFNAAFTFDQENYSDAVELTIAQAMTIAWITAMHETVAQLNYLRAMGLI